MNAQHAQQLKNLIRKTLERRKAVLQSDLLQIPEIKSVGEGVLQSIMDELVSARDIMFLEFVHEDLPGTVHTIYFPVGTVVFEPGLSIKNRVLPDHIEQFFANMVKRNILEVEFVDGLDLEDKIKYYEALHTHVQSHKIPDRKLDKGVARRILERLVIEGKVTLRADPSFSPG